MTLSQRLSILVRVACGALVWVGLTSSAQASTPTAAPPLEADVANLSSSDSAVVGAAIERMSGAADLRALPILEALDDGKLRIDSNGHPFISKDGKMTDALGGNGGEATSPSGALVTPEVDNTIRRSLGPALAALQLTSPDPKVRLNAAQELAKRQSEEGVTLLRAALEREKDGTVKPAIELALAEVELDSKDANRRLAAIEVIGKSGEVSYKSSLERMVARDEAGKFAEPDARVRAAAKTALSSIDSRILFINSLGNMFYGISLGSVLLLASLGLAITFGLMRVINMAHGEMLMLGAYTTYSVQTFFHAHLAGAIGWYLIAAIPCAFLVTMLVGMALERTVIRHLYGRPLETLLATWGISLILIQMVRMVYGAQNVTVENPSWLAGGAEVLPGLVLTYSRLAVIGFSVATMAFTWLVMNKTKLGLELRAVTQNREMAAAIGIATRRVDLFTFGIGSGIAGLGGVALSQLGNVGPELGQTYIVDAFMVVVLGGVGKFAGTIVGAFGLGIANKLLEPAAGAVLGKIIILGFIILFVQKRPQGIFAMKGRAAEAM
ncbi:MAG TPA: urea ABC transporter permease subunit UrtB [Polyangiaceae bacterium]|jgi:urea transport system permease protein|nr:urea ABC transporter permease subunit UrtB [Polyangiaceae bacterium]